MRQLTVISALHQAHERKETQAAVRGSRIGIAVDKDYYATKYQRYARMVIRFSRRLGIDYTWFGECCAICGYPKNICHGH